MFHLGILCSNGVFIIASQGLQNIRLSMALHSEQEGMIFGAIYAWKLSTLTYSNQPPGSWKNVDLSLKFIQSKILYLQSLDNQNFMYMKWQRKNFKLCVFNIESFSLWRKLDLSLVIKIASWFWSLDPIIWVPKISFVAITWHLPPFRTRSDRWYTSPADHHPRPSSSARSRLSSRSFKINWVN